MKTLFYKSPLSYSGRALSPHWIMRNFDLLGSATVAFIGEANVTLSHMVDLEDVKKKEAIYSPLMLHFISEWFDSTLESAVLKQHLFIHLLQEELEDRQPKKFKRYGNDLYLNDRKLNVSIATKSLTSTLMHCGINIQTHQTPVPTIGLAELGIEPTGFAKDLLNVFEKEHSHWQKARYKVRGVQENEEGVN